MDHRRDRHLSPDLRVEIVTLRTPIEVSGYRRLLRSERLSARRPLLNPAICDAWPVYSQYPQLRRYFSGSHDELNETILRISVHYWLEAEAWLLNARDRQSYVLCMYVSPFEPEDYLHPYILFCGSDVNCFRQDHRLVPASSSLAADLAGILSRFEIGNSARLFQLAGKVDPLFAQRVYIDFELPCHPRKLGLFDPSLMHQS